MKHAGKSLRAAETKKNRKSGAGFDGSPKKGGHGGKFTWSGDRGYSRAEMGPLEKGVVDVKDPIFDEEVDCNVQIA